MAGGPQHYALYCEDPDRIKVELVAPALLGESGQGLASSRNHGSQAGVQRPISSSRLSAAIAQVQRRKAGLAVLWRKMC